jgi:hypothetical protein
MQTVTRAARRRTLVLIAIGAALVAIAPTGPWTGSAGRVLAAEPAAEAHATLVINYGEGVEKRWSAVPVREGMTVADVLAEVASRPSPRGIALETRGRGETYFVRSIDGLSNQGGKPTDRNWMLKVGGEMAKKSAGLVEVRAGDTITWTFMTFDWSKDQPTTPAAPTTSGGQGHDPR